MAPACRVSRIQSQSAHSSQGRLSWLESFWPYRADSQYRSSLSCAPKISIGSTMPDASFSQVITSSWFVRSVSLTTGDDQLCLKMIITFKNVPRTCVCVRWEAGKRGEFYLPTPFTGSRRFCSYYTMFSILLFCSVILFLRWRIIELECSITYKWM